MPITCHLTASQPVSHALRPCGIVVAQHCVLSFDLLLLLLPCQHHATFLQLLQLCATPQYACDAMRCNAVKCKCLCELLGHCLAAAAPFSPQVTQTKKFSWGLRLRLRLLKCTYSTVCSVEQGNVRHPDPFAHMLQVPPNPGTVLDQAAKHASTNSSYSSTYLTITKAPPPPLASVHPCAA